MRRFAPLLLLARTPFGRVLRLELHRIRSDRGVLLVLFGAPLIYALLYSSAYAPQRVEQIPIAVVDESQTPTSRRVVRWVAAEEACRVVAEPRSMGEAERLLYDRAIYGILYLPADFDRRLAAGREATVSLYMDGSYLLIYRALFEAWVNVLDTMGAGIELRRLHAEGVELQQADEAVQPIRYAQYDLFNPDLGYATFVMPAVLVLILQQTLLIAIAMVGGRWREEGLYRTLACDPRRRIRSTTIVAGRTTAYLLAELPVVLYLFGVHAPLFGYPMRGSGLTMGVLMLLYVVAVVLLGVAFSTLVRRRETPLMLLFWTSIPLLMVSGLSFPREAMPRSLYALGQLFPSSHAIEAVVRLETMGASAAELQRELTALAVQLLLFALLACGAVGRKVRQRSKKSD